MVGEVTEFTIPTTTISLPFPKIGTLGCFQCARNTTTKCRETHSYTLTHLHTTMAQQRAHMYP